MQPLIPKESPVRNPAVLKAVIFGALAVWMYLAAAPLISAFSAVGRYNSDASCAFTKHEVKGACSEKDVMLLYKLRARKAPDDFTYIDGFGRHYDFGVWNSAGGDALYYATKEGGWQRGRFFEGSLVAVMLSGRPVFGVDSPQERQGLLQANLLPPVICAIFAAALMKGYARS